MVAAVGFLWKKEVKSKKILEKIVVIWIFFVILQTQRGNN
jgi:hypothetical protein